MDKTLYKTGIFFATITIIAFFLISCTTTPTETTKPMEKVIDKLKNYNHTNTIIYFIHS
jgi:starvation-inducible outer membrane lipoprotein